MSAAGGGHDIDTVVGVGELTKAKDAGKWYI